jgi:hypothetical protein
VRRAFGQDDFQRGPDVPFAKMPGFGAAVAGDDYDMNMQGGLALRIISDVAEARASASAKAAERDRPFLIT